MGQPLNTENMDQPLLAKAHSLVEDARAADSAGTITPQHYQRADEAISEALDHLIIFGRSDPAENSSGPLHWTKPYDQPPQTEDLTSVLGHAVGQFQAMVEGHTGPLEGLLLIPGKRAGLKALFHGIDDEDPRELLAEVQPATTTTADASAPKPDVHDADTVLCEATSLQAAKSAEVAATGTPETGTDIPLASPLLSLLERAESVVNKAVRHEETLKELYELCRVTTQQVIDKYQATSSSGFDVSPLQNCIKELDGVAQYCGRSESNLSNLTSLNPPDRIHSLRERIGQLVPTMDLTVGVDTPFHVEAAQHIIVGDACC